MAFEPSSQPMPQDKPAAAPKPLPALPESPMPRKGRLRRFFASVIALLVGGLLIASVWIAGTAIGEKIRLSRGLKQVIDVTLETREMAVADRRIGTVPHEDLLSDLSRLRDYPVAGEAGMLQYLTNPWQGNLIATTGQGNVIRIESEVPAYICRHFVDLFMDDPQAFGALAVEARQGSGPFRRLYTGPKGTPPSDADILAGCGAQGLAVIAITFGLR